jgi:hypothetical protein
MYAGFETVAVPSEVQTERFTVYVPCAVYECTGFASVELVPSPNCHHRCDGAGEDASVNATVIGAGPEVAFAVKAAIGVGPGDGGGVTQIRWSFVVVTVCPLQSVTVTETV